MKTLTKLLLAAMLLTTSSAIIAMDLNEENTDMELVQTEESSGIQPLEKKRSLSESTDEETNQPPAPRKKLNARRPANASTTNQLTTDTTIIDDTANTTKEEPLDKERSRFAPAFEQLLTSKKPRSNQATAAISHAAKLAQGTPLSPQDCTELEEYIARATALFKEGGQAHRQVSTAFAPLRETIQKQLSLMDKITSEIVASTETHTPAATNISSTTNDGVNPDVQNLTTATTTLENETDAAKESVKTNPERGFRQWQQALNKFAATSYLAACTTAGILASAAGSYYLINETAIELAARNVIPALTPAVDAPMMGAALAVGAAGYTLASKLYSRMQTRRLTTKSTPVTENDDK